MLGLVFFCLKWLSYMTTVVFSNEGSSQEIKHHTHTKVGDCLFCFFKKRDHTETNGFNLSHF